jgi:hypothetical protein
MLSVTPWRGGVYHLWGRPVYAECGRRLEELTTRLPRWIADTFARPCKRCVAKRRLLSSR